MGVRSQDLVKLIVPVDLEEKLKVIKEYIEKGNGFGTPIRPLRQAKTYVVINIQLMITIITGLRKVPDIE